MRELECFFQENCYLPPNEKIMVSDRFEDGELLWEIRAVREAELRKMEKETEENLCAAAVVFPDLQDRKLWESYGAKSSYCTERISEAKGRAERNGKKLIQEGIDEADYASYALRKYGVRPKEWVQMDLAERMFYCAVIDLEIEKMQEAERG